jgi:hypothetical protein
MTPQELLDGDFHSRSAERQAQERLAAALAKTAGWKAIGSTYVHPRGGKYLIRDMDGWSDLCSVEGIDAPTTPPPWSK